MFDSIRQFWDQAMAIDEARWVLIGAIFLSVVCVAVYIGKLVRDMALGNSGGGLVDSSEYLTNFQKLREAGKLDDDEFSRLRESIPSAGSDHTDQKPARTNPPDAS